MRFLSSITQGSVGSIKVATIAVKAVPQYKMQLAINTMPYKLLVYGI